MSDLDEPPAKVLKIDTFDGVTHMSELPEYQAAFDGTDEENMCSVSGIIEGGADHCEEQEQWLSEGILTDDDYMPASQDTIEDRNDSQPGSSHNEEHLDSTLDSETLEKGEQHLTENQQNLDQSLEKTEQSFEQNEQSSQQNEHSYELNEQSFELNEQSFVQTEHNFELHEQSFEEKEHSFELNKQSIEQNKPSFEQNEPSFEQNEQSFEQKDQSFDLNEQCFEQNEQSSQQKEPSFELNEQSFELNEQDSLNNVPKLDETEHNLAENQLEQSNKDEQILMTNKALTEQKQANDIQQLVSSLVEQNIENEQKLVQSDQQHSNGSDHYENEEHLVNKSFDSESTSDMQKEQSHMDVDSTPSLDETLENTQNSTKDNNQQKQNAATEPQSLEKLIEMSHLDIDMESQKYTSETSNILIQQVENLNKEQREGGSKTFEINIEEAMKNLDGETEIKAEFDSLLKRNTDIKKEKELKTETKDDDGNDTDDLLRMLEEDDSKSKKKLTKTVKDIRNSMRGGASTDDDDNDFQYENIRIKKMKAAQSVLKKKMATRAEPEDIDYDNIETFEEIKPLKRFNLKSGSSILRQNQNRPNLHIIDAPRTDKPRQYHNRRIGTGQSLLKPTTASANAGSAPAVPTSLGSQGTMSFKPTESKASTPFKAGLGQKNVENRTYGASKLKTVTGKIQTELPQIERLRVKYEPANIKTEAGMIKIEPGKMRVLPEEIIDEEEFLEEEEYGLDEDEFAESDNESSHRQRIMKPELMEEEVPSDGESGDEDASLYDEMPTSDSDDADDWFQLDIRCEKAADYLPLLGARAKELLLEEKRRVSTRLATLSQSHTALASSGRQQAASLRRATAALAEIDDMIRAS